MRAWQPPSGPYPQTPHVVDSHARPEQLRRLVIQTVEAQGGEATFIGYGRWAKRLMGKVCQSLPADYRGQVITFDPASGSPAALGRKARRETRLYVRRGVGPTPPPSH